MTNRNSIRQSSRLERSRGRGSVGITAFTDPLDSVVTAVVHAGIIAVVRQRIIFTPDDNASTQDALLTTGIQVVLLLTLFLVHRLDDPVRNFAPRPDSSGAPPTLRPTLRPRRRR
ncbi:hypothetical protein [Halomicrococcus gelatinilyticus]|uniref:hypothetical protein n=1 Tax=Halomicrococcus gelatinilyticus TaxID=1702103 RepID=UPI002E11BC9E